MTKKLAWLLGASFLLAVLTGCQLAREGEAANGGPQDKLCGVFITFEPLGINEPLYATAKEEAIEGTRTTTFEFPGFKGLSYFTALVVGEDEAKTYSTSIGSPEIMDGSTNLAYSDEGTKITLVGKIYTLKDFTVFINPVYQDASGRIYVKPGGTGYYAGAGKCSVTLSEETKMTRNQAGGTKAENYCARVELIFEKVETPVDVVFKEMNGDDEVMRTTLVLPDDIPDSLFWLPDCAYVLAIARSGKGGNEVTRTILNIDEQYYIYKYAGENGCLTGKMIEIERLGDN